MVSKICKIRPDDNDHISIDKNRKSIFDIVLKIINWFMCCGI